MHSSGISASSSKMVKELLSHGPLDKKVIQWMLTLHQIGWWCLWIAYADPFIFFHPSNLLLSFCQFSVSYFDFRLIKHVKDLKYPLFQLLPIGNKWWELPFHDWTFYPCMMVLRVWFEWLFHISNEHSISNILFQHDFWILVYINVLQEENG